MKKNTVNNIIVTIITVSLIACAFFFLNICLFDNIGSSEYVMYNSQSASEIIYETFDFMDILLSIYILCGFFYLIFNISECYGLFNPFYFIMIPLKLITWPLFLVFDVISYIRSVYK